MSIEKIAVMPFESVNGTAYRVEIYKRFADGAVVPSVRTLTPAASPFVTRENDSDDPLEPVRGSTGYCRFWYDGGTNDSGAPYWVDFMPVDATDISVYLTDAEGVIYWQGFVKPSQYSHDYNEPQQEIELPLCSMLEVLGSIEMSADNVMAAASFRELIIEAVNATGLSMSNIYVPYEWGTKELTTKAIYTGVADFDWQAPFVTKVSRFAFFDATDAKNGSDPDWREYEGKTYGEMLAAWCQYWGWCLRERGTSWYLASARAKKYIKVSWAILQREAMLVTIDKTTVTDAATITLTDDDLDGIGHSLSITQPVRTVEVSADTQQIDTDIVQITDNDARYMESSRQNWVRQGFARTIQEVDYAKLILYKIKGGSAKVWDEEKNISGKLNTKVTNFVRMDHGKATDLSDKKNWSFADGIFVQYSVNVRNEDNTPVFDDPRIIEVKSRKSFVIKDGALAINVKAKFLKYGVDWSLLKLKLRFGNKYWNGTEWTETESVFGLPIKTDNASQGWEFYVEDGKTLDMDCNGAEGYIIPISEELSGIVTLSWLAQQSESEMNYIFVQDFGVEYYGADDAEYRNLDSINRYYARTGAGGKDKKTIALTLATENNNNAGFGLLRTSGGVATGETYRTPQEPGTAATVARPEEVLLYTAKKIYGAPRMMLEMVVSAEGRERPIDKMKRAEWADAFVPAAESMDWANDRRTVRMLGNG